MFSQSTDPIHLSEVADVFTDRAIGGALKRAGVRIEATAMTRLSVAIRASVAEYTTASRRHTPNTIRREIAAVASLLDVREKTEGNYRHLATMWAALPGDARQLLADRLELIRELEQQRLEAWDKFAVRRGGQLLRPRPKPVFADAVMPTAADLKDPDRRAGACSLLAQLIGAGRGRDRNWPEEPACRPAPICIQTAPGIANQVNIVNSLFRFDTPDGPRISRKLRVHAPTPSRAEPRREAVRELVIRLSLDWWHVTGTKPTLTARISATGPFAKFIAEILNLARVPIKNGYDHDRQGLAVETLNHLHTIRRRRLTEQPFRRILQPRQ